MNSLPHCHPCLNCHCVSWITGYKNLLTSSNLSLHFIQSDCFKRLSTPFCLNVNGFPLFHRIKNSFGLHILVYAYASPFHFTSCSVLSALQTYIEHYAPSGHRPFAPTFLSNKCSIHFLYSYNSESPAIFSDHPLWSK